MTDQELAQLVAQVEAIIFETFEISRTEAHESAEGMVLLGVGWGGEAVAKTDWVDVVNKKFGEKFKWKSEVARKRYVSDVQATHKAYENYIRERK